MKLPYTPEEKVAYVKETYITDIIPRIGMMYEKTNQVREVFILVHCAILSLSGFYKGTQDTDGNTYNPNTTPFPQNSFNLPHKVTIQSDRKGNRGPGNSQTSVGSGRQV